MTNQAANYINSERERLSFGNENPHFIAAAMIRSVGKYIQKNHRDLFNEGAAIYGAKRTIIQDMLDGINVPQAEIDDTNSEIAEFNEKADALGLGEYAGYTTLNADMFNGLPAGYMAISENQRPSIVQETEKAYAVPSRVNHKGVVWLPKSKVIAENGQIAAYATEIAREKYDALPDMFK